ncbi:ABC-2 type transport system permease protein [Amphibacillus marinus]|uniref:Transport permease protein n=1 Tax=Amphibacillus marinus TaxID=872970 RepID=A0A1H8QT39_9BACI|nr:ABC transporter permease [Amphibacillus marinus]SEO57197.1 ABC-2 type transport system permease protein [Amphibacillus marinus]
MKQSKINTNQLRAVLTKQERPEPPNPLYAITTFSWRALLKIKRHPEQLLDVAALPILFLLMFTYLFGGAIAGSSREYLQFILPGILVQTVTQITMYTGMDLNKDIQKGFFDRLRTLPIWLPSSLLGSLLVDSFRYLIASTVMVSFSLLLGFRPQGGVVGVISAIALILVFCFSLSWVWNTLALLMRSEQSLMMLSMMVIFPLTFLSSAFVDPTTMPTFLENVVKYNPVSILVDAVRGLMHGNVELANIGLVFLSSVIIIIIFAPLTLFLYRRRK